MKSLRLLLSVTLLPVMLLGQESFISQKFSSYASKAYAEKIYARTDRTDYLAGEILWWKIYYVDGYAHKPATLSKIAYVELLDNQNKPVIQEKIGLTKNGGDGSFYLPLSFGTGTYTLRAYTSWMKNFSQDYVFSKEIRVINPLRAQAIPAVQSDVFYDAGFFPEGGYLVRNLESRVGFRVTDQFGTGQKFRGVLVDENRDTVLSFVPMKSGIGSFRFTPTGTHRYQAILRLENDQTIVRELPLVQEKGYVMTVTASDAEIAVRVKTSLASDQVKLFVHSGQVEKISASARVENGETTFRFSKAKLGEGISHFTIFDGANQPLCERLFFIYPSSELSIDAGSDAREYGRRKKVSLSLQTKAREKNVTADLSVSVFRLDSLYNPSSVDIQSYLSLISDLRGTVEDPSSYFKSRDVEAIDNLMLTHGWRRFSWKEILQNEFKVVNQAEFDGQIITGRLTDGNSGAGVADEALFLGIPGTLTQFYTTRSDSNGRFHFDVRDYYGPGDLILQSDTSVIANRKITVDNPFLTAPKPLSHSSPLLVNRFSEELAKASFAMQVQNVYSGDSLHVYALPELDSMAFYGKHGKVYNLDAYTRFTTMEEVLREYVLEVGIRLRGGTQHLMILDFVNKGFLSQEPLILLDGVPVSHSSILAYDPLKVRKLQVVAARYIIGELVYDGVVSFTTYQRTAEDFPQTARMTKIPYEGLQLQREFFSPAYNTESQVNNRIPDYRRLLYWNPNITTGRTGTATTSFYTSDIPGKYLVTVEGLDGNGDAGSRSFTFEVLP